MINLISTKTFWFNLIAILVELANETIAHNLFGGKIPLEYLTAIIVIGNVIGKSVSLSKNELYNYSSGFIKKISLEDFKRLSKNQQIYGYIHWELPKNGREENNAS